MHKNQQVMNLAVLAGTILLENGAEIYRVQETVIRIVEAFGIYEHNVYVTSNSIFATLCESTQTPVVAVRYVKQSVMCLRRISAVNEVSREIEAKKGEIDMEQYTAQLTRCATLAKSPGWLRLIACAVGSASFCYIFGGKLGDAAGAFFAGMALNLFLGLGEHHKRNKYISLVLGSALVTLCCNLLFLPGLVQSVDMAIIGSIMPLVPGMLLTTAIRDFFNSDYLSGIIHLTDALLVAVCVAVGVGAMLLGWNFLFGGM